MADIFFSYAREDRATAQLLVRALQEGGLTVWWDTSIDPGQRVDTTIHSELAIAKCVIVAWSKHSIDSDYVRDEAEMAKERHILFPIRIDDCTPPLGFRGLQTLDLLGRLRPPNDPRIQQLIAAARRMCGLNQLTASVPSTHNHRSFLRRIIADFLDKKNGRGLSLERFSKRFEMQSHTGFCGAFFAASWFLTAIVAVPALLTNALFVTLALIIVGVFGVLAWLSLRLAGSYSPENLQRHSAENAPVNNPRLDVRVRIWMTALSIAYVATICALIWLTGGAYSPFTPFYVMIFTLTITQNKVPYPGVPILMFFLIMFAIASVAAERVPLPIERTVLAQIQQGPLPYYIAAIFVALSLIVPTISDLLIGDETKQRTAEAPTKGSTP